MSELEYCAFCDGGYAHSGICDKCTAEIGQTGKELADKDKQLAEARAEIERLRGVIISQITPEPVVLSSYSATTEPAKDERDKLIEQMREALKAIDGIGREEGNVRREDALRCFAIAAAALVAERGE